MEKTKKTFSCTRARTRARDYEKFNPFFYALDVPSFGAFLRLKLLQKEHFFESSKIALFEAIIKGKQSKRTNFRKLPQIAPQLMFG